MIHKFILTALLVLTVSSAQVVTTTKVQEASGVGIGKNRSEAVNEAIIEAVGQISGVKINKKSIIENLEVEDEQGSKLNLKYNAQINKYTNGKADSFKVLSVQKRTDGLYEATVKVTNMKVTKQYKTPGLDNSKRRSIVIVPGNFTEGYFNLMGENKSSFAVNINLSQELLNAVTQTRKFNVLDREESRAFFNEQNVFKSKSVNSDEALKLGKVLGADYLLLTSIKDLSIAEVTKNKYVSNSSDSYLANATVQYKVLTTATRQVKFSNTQTYNFELSGKTNKEMYYNFLSQLSIKISSELIENIYPLKIIDVNNGEITLNQGNLIMGNKYNVYKLGQKMIDSYTKESLGRKETKVGTIEIVRSLPKYSIAALVDGTAMKGDIVRTFQSEQSGEFNNIGQESDVEVSTSGGVLLPFE